MENDDIILSPGDVCTLIRIKESTLRKYALILQDAGYHFDVNDKGQRAYYNRDVIALKKLIEINKNTDMTLEQSANAVITWFKQSNMSLRAIDKTQENERYNSDIQELKEMVHNQNLAIKTLVQKLDEQQKALEEREKRQAERDLERDRVWMEFVRDNQQFKQQYLQIAAAQEEEKKKGFFAKLFGK